MKKFRLLVNCIDGYQRLETYGEGGGYFDLTRVVFDERVDGPFPAEALENVGMLASMVVDGKKVLCVDEKMQAAHDARQAEAETAEKERLVKLARFETLKAKIGDSTASLTDMQELLSHLLN